MTRGGSKKRNGKGSEQSALLLREMRSFIFSALLGLMWALPTPLLALELNEAKAHAVCTQKSNGGWKCDGPLQKVSYGKAALPKALKESGCPGGVAVGQKDEWQIYECAGYVGKRDILMRYGISERHGPSPEPAPEKDPGLSQGIVDVVTKGSGRLCDKQVKIERTLFDPSKNRGIIKLKIDQSMVTWNLGPAYFPKKNDHAEKMKPTSERQFKIYALSRLEADCSAVESKKQGSTVIPALKNYLREKFKDENGILIIIEKNPVGDLRG